MNCYSIDASALVLLHQECLRAYGGQEGVRDWSMLDAALSWPLHCAAEREMDVAALAAAYAFGILRHAPFVDGNPRAALLAMGLFLYLNGWQLAASPLDAAQVVQAAATGAMDQARLADWIRANL